VLREPETAVRIGREAQTVARGRFTSERLVSDMESLYQRLLIEKRLK